MQLCVQISVARHDPVKLGNAVTDLTNLFVVEQDTHNFPVQYTRLRLVYADSQPLETGFKQGVS